MLMGTTSNSVSTPRTRSLSLWSSIIGDTGAAVTRPRWKRRSRALALGNRECAGWQRVQRACRRLRPRLEPRGVYRGGKRRLDREKVQSLNVAGLGPTAIATAAP